MNRFNLSGGRAAALMIGSLVIATASMVVSVVVVAGAQTATDSTIPASHQEHEGGMGHGGNHDGGGHGAGGHEGRLAATAEYQGLDPGSLKSQLTEGAEIAGDDLDGLFARQLALAGGHIGQAVTDGRIDQARADEMLARLGERIAARMNGEMLPAGMGHGGNHEGGMGYGGMGHGA